MQRLPPSPLVPTLCILTGLALCVRAWADPNVVVTSSAGLDYTERKFGGPETKTETYVVMQGHYFEGAAVDRSIERLPFRRIAEVFAPELARRKFFPAKSKADADLLIVIHWGTTLPHVTADEMRAKDSPITDTSTHPDVIAHNQMVEQAAASGNDGLGVLLGAYNPAATLANLEQLDEIAGQATADLHAATNAQLLGYTRELRAYNRLLLPAAEEATLRQDLGQARYFLILKAYDLRAPKTAGPLRAVWTLHLNMSSSGNNFTTALDRMSLAAAKFAGESTQRITTVKPAVREGRVEVGTPIVIADKK